MSASAVSSTAAAAASTSLYSVNRRRTFLAFTVPAPLSWSLPWKLSSSSPSHSPLAPVTAMASAGGGVETVSRKKLHILEAEEDLAASLAEYRRSCRRGSPRKGALSLSSSPAAPLSSPSGSWRSHRTLKLWTGANGTCSGWMKGWCPRTTRIATTSSPWMGCSLRCRFLLAKFTP